MTAQPADTGNEPNLTRPGSIAYMQIPAPDPRAAGTLDANVFGWNVRGDQRPDNSRVGPAWREL
jgi:hypothetical protein